ncbi:acyltransferase family protein [Paenibacillus pinistramenti]|uniref:acyltransferase family protein n=1 Tax=Paenibacillus pinistramenti TaxID=1768003 RepID=UPI001107E1D7|nr:acyltransferase family protein [Paenibacillus pinistramenti]
MSGPELNLVPGTVPLEPALSSSRVLPSPLQASASVTAERRRDRSIDLFKGLLVAGMVYCHCLQFFSDQQVYPAGQRWIDIINLITFSGFVFSFGYASQLAYYSKSFRRAAPRMLLTAFKMLVAFWLSGLAYRLFIDGRPLSWAGIRPVLLVEEMPGWSEFLISFAYLTLAGLVLFVPLKWAVRRKAAGFLAAALLLAATYIPYGAIHAVKLGPLIGTRDFASFPAVQYFPYYLLGMLFAKYRIGWDWRVLAGAAAASACFVWKWLAPGEGGVLPERFPPSLWWIIGPALVLYGYYLLARVLGRFQDRWMERSAHPFYLLQPLEVMGRNVLWFLLLSNMLIFAAAASQRSYGLLLPPGEAFILALALLAVTGFSLWIMSPGKAAGRPERRPERKLKG